jgi:hypothetical protein
MMSWAANAARLGPDRVTGPARSIQMAGSRAKGYRPQSEKAFMNTEFPRRATKQRVYGKRTRSEFRND